MKKLSLIFLLVFPWICSAAGIQVDGVRTWQAPDNTRVVFDVSSASAEYKVFKLLNPPRLVIDFKNTRLTGKMAKPAGEDLILKNIRSAVRPNKDLRVVLDLHDKTKFKSFLLKPYKKYGHRLVVDLLHGGRQKDEPKAAAVKDAAPKNIAKARPPRAEPKLRDLVIAIDAGHGGEDPGALGPRGTHEKDVVFAIAKKLAALIEREKGMRPLMIEIQALVSTAVYGTPQRSTTGYNAKRLNMLLAVLEKRAGFKLGAKDVFLNITGGISVDDPAIDLAVIAAILSSNEDIPIEKGVCFAAEVGLAGEIRPVQRIEQRILEAEKLGFNSIYVSKNNKISLKNPKINIELVTRIEDVVNGLFG